MKTHADFCLNRILLIDEETSGLATYIDLTIEQAESLAQDLLSSAQELRRMNKECQEHFESEEKK